MWRRTSPSSRQLSPFSNYHQAVSKTRPVDNQFAIAERRDGYTTFGILSLLPKNSRRRFHARARRKTGPMAAETTMAATVSGGPAATVLNHSVKPYTFGFSRFLREAYQVGLPVDRPICKAYQTGSCPNGTRCTERHVADGSRASGSSSHHPTGGVNSLVCKHWLRGLCKKGVPCEFLHEYNLRRMPECNFFMRNGYCSNGEECLYLHVDPLSKLPPCPHYDMGFCPLGPVCSKKHELAFR
ncbi:hypothetical protein LLEC1_06412 [Akanthomyces lecanii]|uniref:mRNA 3'-end-processing protein n=1 Tax=Cordyceps confragosa TaxID=2714763 RepID=A0A179IHB3_CORDF|nr:hypothetical protein LLEC1_06412 [Akanthomyces lecanii]